MRRAWARMRDRIEHKPLASRITLVMLLVLGAALALAGGLMVSLLQRQLVGQVDKRLEEGVTQVAASSPMIGAVAQDVPVPSDFFIQVLSLSGTAREWITGTTEAQAGRPRIPSAEIAATITKDEGYPAKPYTVPSSSGRGKWRALTVPVAVDGEPTGALTLALPLDGVQETISSTAFTYAVASVFLMFAAGIVGSYLVVRSLRHLREIEVVAGAIAAGDLTRRIPNAPLSTEVGSLSASLNSMLVQIERSFASREKSEQKMRTFVSDASHELRTPLAAIHGYAELYRMGAVKPEDVGDVMRRVEAESSRMAGLVEDLLRLARLDERPDLRI